METVYKFGYLREDGYRFRGYSAKGKEVWLNPQSWIKSRETARFYFIKKNYGLERAEYDAMLASQNHNCAICGEDFSDNTRNIHVDHCHTTGKNRGLLCQFCNQMIGMARDKIDVLQSAVRYLQESCHSP